MKNSRGILIIIVALAVTMFFVACSDEDGGTGPETIVTFEKIFDFGFRDQGYGLCEASNGNIIVVGNSIVHHIDTSGTDTVTSEDLLVMKFKGGGDTVWTCTAGDTLASDFGDLIIPAVDGGYLAVGQQSYSGVRRIYLQKMLETGEPDWSEYYSYGKSNHISDIIIAQDGYVLAGNSSSPFVGTNLLVMKVDQSGGFPWDYTSSTTPTRSAAAVIELPDKSLFVAGQSSLDQDTDIYVFLLDPIGDSIWANTIDLGGNEYSRMVSWNEDGYIVYGTTNGPSGDGYFILKTDTLGRQISTHISYLTDDVWIAKIRPAKDGKKILCGYTNRGFTDNNGYLALADTDGEILWERTFSDPDGYIRLRDAIWLSGGGFAAVGEIEYGLGGDRDLYLIRTDANGLIDD